MSVDPRAIAKESLLNEIRALKQAGKHPNIVTLIGTRIEGGKLESDLRSYKHKLSNSETRPEKIKINNNNNNKNGLREIAQDLAILSTFLPELSCQRNFHSFEALFIRNISLFIAQIATFSF